ncbi:MAG TPA: xanthine dehydrogenase family protein subunit M [Syntrophales bacterium]|jgi:carbon-monoxide dehydrogenase medium subunit|nr:xanthine dehydrogenase family protein subunit M [Syntrophales bacterium]
MLLLPEFEYYEPTDMDTAYSLLDQLKSDGKIIAGGTDVLVNLKEGKIHPGCLISIARISGLSAIEKKGTEVVIGSQTLAAAIAESELIRVEFPILSHAASKLGSPLIRNRATIGGNIVTARPAADLIPPLMALGATIELRSKGGTRTLHLEEFLVGPGQTTINPNEILTKIVIPEAKPFSGGDYMKLGHRKSLEIAIIAVASVLTLDETGKTIKDAKVILSAVAPKAIHAVSAENELIGAEPTPELFEAAAVRAMSDCSPISDIRGGSEYRKEMVKVLTGKTLLNALDAARGGK